MALPATDAFTGTNGTQLATYSGSWTVNNGDFDIQSNALCPDSATGNYIAHWNADTFGDDQYAQGNVSGSAVDPGIGPAVRVAASAHTGYILITDFFDVYFTKFVSGTETSLDTKGSAPTSGHLFRIEAEGTTLRPIINGVSPPSGLTNQTDSAIASGSAGVAGYNDGTNVNIDNWEGGNIGAAPSATRRYSLSLTGVG